MRRLPMLAEGFAVVRGDADERLGEASGFPEGPEEPPDPLVGARDLPLVRAAREAGVPGRGRLVGVVGVEEVDPEEEPSPGREACEPGQGPARPFLGGP